MGLVELFQIVELFSGLNEAQLRRLTEISQTVQFKEGDIVFAQGDPGDQLYVVQEGQFEVIVGEEPEAVRSTVVYLGKGQLFGEMALIDYGERSATIRCASDTAAVQVIERNAFLNLCASDTAIGFTVMRNIASDLSFKLRRRNLNLESQ